MDGPENLFEGLEKPDGTKPNETVFDNIYSDLPQDRPTPALPTTTLMMAVANLDTSKNPSLQMMEESIQTARDTIETGQELTERNRIAAERAIQQAASIDLLRKDAAKLNLLSPEDEKNLNTAYTNVLTEDRRKKAAAALEQQAIDKIREVASRDPVQAKVLLDNLQFGGADQTHHDFLVKSAILAQRAEEIDEEYNQSGWGRAILNFMLNLAPTNYNFQRAGIVEGADTGILDWLRSGEGLRKQSETMWNMDVDTFAEFAKKDGELMQSLRSNSTTLFGLTQDPLAARMIIENLVGQDDDTRQWSNIWGSIEPVFLLPVGKIVGASKNLARAGARKEAETLLGNAAEVLAREGEEAMIKKTAITAEELEAAQSIAAVNPDISGKFSVSFSEDLATREEAARQALSELPQVIRESRLTSPEEIINAFESIEKRIADDIGREIKDISFVRTTETLSTGNELRAVEYIFGKKSGGGYASKQTASNAAKSSGLDGAAFRAEDGQWYVRGKVNVAEQGFYTDPLHAATQGFLGSLTGRWWRSSARTTDPSLHGKAVSAGAAIGRQQKILGQMVNESFRSIPAKSQEIVQQVALIGANNKKWYSAPEFNSLIRRAYNRDATEGELRVYQDFQKFNDMDWVLRNDQIFLEKTLKGMESVRFRARGVDWDIDAIVSYQPKLKPSARIFNASEGVHYTAQKNPLTDAGFEKMINDGYVLIKPEEAIRLADGTVVNQIMIKKADLKISPLRRNQLNYQPGGHRLYTDKYFIKQANIGTQPDTLSEYLLNPRTFRTAGNIAEARAWADVMNQARLAVKESRMTAQELDDLVFKGDRAYPSGEKFLAAVDEGGISLDHAFEAVFHNELPSIYKNSGKSAEDFVNPDEVGFNSYYRTTGKMYTGHKGEILRDTSGDIATTVDPYEALTTSLRQVTRNSGLFNYKVEAVERFLKTYRNDLDLPEKITSPYQQFNLATKGRDTSLEQWNKIESQRFAIRNVLAYETPLERGFNETWRHVAEAALGTGDNFARKLAHDSVWWFKEKNPVAAIRGFVFDAKLGMFNIGQLFIQSSTMASAMALSPKAGFKGMMTAVPLHSYLLSKGSEQVLDVLAKRGVGKLAGFSSEQEFKEYARYMHKTGFMDMNGSHIMIGDAGPTAHFGSFAEKANRFREAGRMFFYSAETYNRLVSFRIGWDETLEKGLKPGDPGFNASLLKLADDYSLNMTHESAAYWQKGVLSIPTQFWSYNMRMFDAMFGSRFTKTQRARLIAANLLMAGSAGVPLVEGLSHYIKSETGESPEIDTLAGTLDRGFLDRLMFEATGADVRVGEKVGTGGWVRDVAESLLGTSQYGEKSFVEVVGGASYSIVSNMSKVLADVIKYSAAESGGDMGSYELSGDAVLRLAQEVSTLGNISKAIFAMNYQAYKSNSGTIYKDLPSADAFYIALGFKPQEITTMSYRQAYLTNRKEVVNEAVTKITKWKQEAFTNPDLYEENMKKVNMFVKLLPADIRHDVLKSANRRDANETLYDVIERKYEEEAAKEELYNDEELQEPTLNEEGQ